MNILIRSATLADAPAVQRLAGQLGYPMDFQTLSERLATILGDSGQTLLVAESESQVCGWVYLLAGPDLLSGATAEIGGLVVDENRRGLGVGKALLQRAWEWTSRKGYSELRVRSNTAREPYVKAFYLANGYELVKTQWVLKRPTTEDGRPLTADR
jgi:GNAT superfamily N-acetyltransferase